MPKLVAFIMHSGKWHIFLERLLKWQGNVRSGVRENTAKQITGSSLDFDFPQSAVGSEFGCQLCGHDAGYK